MSLLSKIPQYIWDYRTYTPKVFLLWKLWTLFLALFMLLSFWVWLYPYIQNLVLCWKCICFLDLLEYEKLNFSYIHISPTQNLTFYRHFVILNTYECLSKILFISYRTNISWISPMVRALFEVWWYGNFKQKVRNTSDSYLLWFEINQQTTR